MTQPTNSDTLEEILQLHWMDGAKLAGGSYVNEPSLNAKQALTTLTEREERQKSETEFWKKRARKWKKQCQELEREVLELVERYGTELTKDTKTYLTRKN